MKVSVVMEVEGAGRWRWDVVAKFFRTLLSGEPVRMTVDRREYQVAAFWSLAEDSVEFSMESVTEE